VKRTMKNLGSFNEKSVALFEEHFKDNTDFSESTVDYVDFARCQRPDGSYYGTSGQCRKGKETSAKSKDEVGTGKPSGKIKSGGLGEMTIKTPADMKKMSDADLKAHMKLANKVAFQNDVSKLTKEQFNGLADQHKMAKRELESRGAKAPAPKGKIKDPVPGVLKSQAETARIKKEAMADQMKKNPKLAKMAADMKARKQKEEIAKLKGEVKALDKDARAKLAAADRKEASYLIQKKKTERDPSPANKKALAAKKKEMMAADKEAKAAGRLADKEARKLAKATAPKKATAYQQMMDMRKRAEKLEGDVFKAKSALRKAKEAAQANPDSASAKSKVKKLEAMVGRVEATHKKVSGEFGKMADEYGKKKLQKLVDSGKVKVIK